MFLGRAVYIPYGQEPPLMRNETAQVNCEWQTESVIIYRTYQSVNNVFTANIQWQKRSKSSIVND